MPALFDAQEIKKTAHKTMSKIFFTKPPGLFWDNIVNFWHNFDRIMRKMINF
jgi:hypothetical protein